MKMLTTLDRSSDEFDVLFIDDHSEDGTVEKLRALGYAVLSKKSALGLTDSWNFGYSHFLKYGYKMLFLANNDVLVPDGSIGAIQGLLKYYPFMAPSTTRRGGECAKDANLLLSFPLRAYDSSLLPPIGIRNHSK